MRPFSKSKRSEPKGFDLLFAKRHLRRSYGDDGTEDGED